jgi:hypothetical protein
MAGLRSGQKHFCSPIAGKKKPLITNAEKSHEIDMKIQKKLTKN